MKILFLTSHFPYPAHSGGALRAYGLLQGAAAAGHEVSLLCFADHPPIESPLHTLCQHLITLPVPVRRTIDRLKDIVLTSRADIAGRFWNDRAAQQMVAAIKDFEIDVVHAESIEMAAYFDFIRKYVPDVPLIYGSLNAEFDLQRSIFRAELQAIKRWPAALYSWIQWRRLTQLERQLCDYAARVLAVSETDRELLQGLSSTPVHVVKNGITVADYLQVERTHKKENAIVFTGSMSYRPNVDAVVWFADEVLPEVMTDYQFYVVGHRPAARVQALASNPNVTITGRVDEIIPYYAMATVYVAPLRMGSGTRFKILEAMAAGCAVVSTTIGAQGLGVQSGTQLLLADSAEEFSIAVQRILEQPDLREQLAHNGRQFVQEHFDWSVIIPDLLAVYAVIEQE